MEPRRTCKKSQTNKSRRSGTMIETYNIKDLWICPKCGRFGYSKFERHTKRIGKSALCEGKPVMYNTWKQRKK